MRLTGGKGHHGQCGRDVYLWGSEEDMLTDELCEELVRDGGAGTGKDFYLSA